jgi:hypothetical protein
VTASTTPKPEITTPTPPTIPCPACKAPIVFCSTVRGKHQPVDPDGEIHFATCPARQRPTLPDNVCVSCGSLDVVRGPGKGPHAASLRCRDCGAFRWLRQPDSALQERAGAP